MSNTGIRNLYLNTNGYYVYRRPDTLKRFGFGRDGRLAKQTAKELNEKLMNPSGLAAKVLGERQESVTFSQHATFVDETVWQQRLLIPAGQEKHLSKKTYYDYGNLVRGLLPAFGDLPLNDAVFSVRKVSDFLEKQTPNMSRAYRAVLSILFNAAKTRGFMVNNPAQSATKAIKNVKRRRLSINLFNAIYEEVDPWVQRAMLLALYLGSRVSDCSALTWENVIKDGDDTVLYILPKKTERNKKATGQKVKAEGPFLLLLQDCRDEAASPYLLHFPYRAGRQNRHTGKRLTAGYLSKEFMFARKKVFKKEPGLFVTPDETDPQKKKNRPMGEGEFPSWHEIRSLAGDLMEQSRQDGGRSAQKLLGHGHLATAQLYLSRRQIEWVEVDVNSHVPSFLNKEHS